MHSNEQNVASHVNDDNGLKVMKLSARYRHIFWLLFFHLSQIIPIPIICRELLCFQAVNRKR